MNDVPGSREPTHVHEALLGDLDRLRSVSAKLAHIHDIVHRQFPILQRITVALHDPDSDLLKTFCSSDLRDNPLRNYAAPLADSPALQELARSGQPRVIDDLAAYDSGRPGSQPHIVAEGYRSSYTMPMQMDGHFAGLLFFDATEPAYFTPARLASIDPFAHLIALTVIRELSVGRTLLAAIKTARAFAEHRDSGTGAHLDRMSRYARLIAVDLAESYGLDDEAIEFIFLFAPLHDIGKIGIPDAILLKPGQLDSEEFEAMKLHVDVGREIVEEMIDDFGFEQFGNVSILRNIVHHHHEAFDGSGYPDGLQGEAIPIEARIIAVADVFDALTSRRPYKQALSVEASLAQMEVLAGSKLDPQCLAALRRNPQTLDGVQAEYAENPIG
ncbi:MAG: HD domain-containing protein [Gammaproteobacteria bacterium]|jgi:HD-GYP domain-containing protein (c-di-GMP phosphodiesterase class II)|nr:HD domain-containing protein [Gammaproteobacteria bacterium]